MYQKSSPKETGFVFRHFNRKGFSLFAAIGREIKVGVLTVATLSTAAPCLAESNVTGFVNSADHTDKVTSLDEDQLLGEAVTTAARTPLAAAVAARPVMTLGQSELSSAGITCVNDVLKLCAGIDVRQRGSFGLQTDISIDGGTFDQIAILVNGIPITNPQTGHNAADFPLNLSDIERIEVLEGAASRVLGTQAFSGAINIVTRDARTGWQLRAAAGSYGTVQTEARGAWQKQWSMQRSLATSISGSFQRSDGAVANGDFSGGKAFWQMRYDDSDLRLHAQVGATHNDFGANTFYSALYPNQWEATTRYLAAVKGETKGRVHFAPQVSWLRSIDHFQLIRNTHTAENFHRGDVFSIGFNAWTQWKLGRTAVGAEMREESLYSTNLGTPLDSTRRLVIAGKTPTLQANGTYADVAGGAAFYDKHIARTNVSYFLEHTVVLPQWTFSVGAMAQRNDALDHKFHFYPGFDVAFRPSTTWRIYASWNRALRLPTFTDLFYKSPTQQGNIGLQPETCSAFRLGTQAQVAQGVTLAAHAFYQRGTDMIDWVMFASNDKYHATNFQLNNYGIGLSAVVDAQKIFGSAQPIERFRVDYAWMHQNRKDAQVIFKSNYALEYLRHKFVAMLDHRIYGRFGATWTFRLQERNGNYLLFDAATHKPTDTLVPYGTYGRLDVKLNWTHQHYTLFCDLHNLTNHRHFDIGNVEQPGFFVMAGGTLRF